MRVKSISVKDGKEADLSRFPNFHKTGSVKGMKKLYYGENALLVKCGDFIYNVTSEPLIYDSIQGYIMSQRRNNKIKQAIDSLKKKFPESKGYEFKRQSGNRLSFRHVPSGKKIWVDLVF